MTCTLLLLLSSPVNQNEYLKIVTLNSETTGMAHSCETGETTGMAHNCETTGMAHNCETTGMAHNCETETVKENGGQMNKGE